MKSHYDPWYLRLPDGRVVKAKSTSSVRHHVEAGTIPLNSMARRDSHEEWVLLSWIAEFSDLGGGSSSRRQAVPGEEPRSRRSSGNGSSPELNSGISARFDPLRLQTVGIRGLVDELIAAFDSAIGAGKGAFACATLALAILLLHIGGHAILAVYPEGFWLVKLLEQILAGLVLSVIIAVLTRQTHLELSIMRPVPFAEAWHGSGIYIFRIFLGYAATVGVCMGLIFALQYAPEGVASLMSGTSGATTEVVYTLLWGISLVIASILCIFILLAFLMAPILVVEECSVGDALREWRTMLREHRVRVMVYEGLAVALALIAALPLALPAYVVFHLIPPVAGNWFSTAIPLMIYAIVCGPALTFLAIANLFIYLNLRYEYSPSK